jgi:hypothetical protein
VVFISSAQKEFQDLRDFLKDEIDKESLFDKYVMEAELVERREGETIEGDMASGLKRSSIYVGIFGNDYSKDTIDEYLEARRQGIPLLIFELAPKARYKNRRDPKVTDFLENQVKGKDRCRIMKLRAAYLENSVVILQRIADRVAEIVRQYHEIRRITHQRDWG